MSQQIGSDGRPIPTAVLVSVSGKGGPPERPAPKRRATRKSPPVPWLKIIAGGSVAWVGVIVVMALYAVTQNRTPPNDGPAIPANAVLQAEQAPRDLAPLAEPFVEPDAAPIPAAPKLPFRDAKAINPVEAPPGLDLFPEEFAKLDPPLVDPARPENPAPARKPGRKDVDLALFASCDAIGTNVLFMKDPPEAFKRAKTEKKMVFMVHLSGNLEDKGFT